MIVMCENFGWTYEEYLTQPRWFVELYFEKMRIDSHKQNESQSKVKNKK